MMMPGQKGRKSGAGLPAGGFLNLGPAKNMSKKPLFEEKIRGLGMFLELRECKARSNSVSEGAKDHKYSLFNTGGLLRRTEKMEAILMKAASFIAVIILGYGLRKAGFFKEEDFYVLSKIVLKITLPASIIANFSQTEIQPAMLLLCLVGFAGGVLYMSLGWILGGKDRDEKAFHIMNMSGYNIGNFTMPFTAGFFGPTGVVITSLFDTGNAFICLGGAYSVASMAKDKNSRFSVGSILKTLIKSAPFDAYIGMLILSLIHVSLPTPAVSIAQLIGNANAFMAMLMLGVGFKLSGDKKQIGKIGKILSIRYGVAVVASLMFYFVLPLPLEYRQTLAVLVFSPIAAAAPAFTGDLKGDIGLASAVNSISIIISMVMITTVLIVVL